MMRNKSKIIEVFLLLLVTEWMLSCGSSTEGVATVGNRNITSKEFALAYELAPKSKTQSGRTSAYNSVINGIIDRILLAEEGYRRGYDADPAINRIIDFYKRAAIVRELFLKHVRDSVEVSEEEKRLAYKKMKTTLYVKNYVLDNIVEKNPASIPHTPLGPGLETIQHDTYGYIDIVHWNDLERDVEDILFQLEVNELSNPYFDGKQYHIFKVIEKEYDSMLTENDFYSRSPAIRKVIRRRKEHAVAFKYVQNLMNPQNLIIKSNSLGKLTDLFWESQTQSGNMIHVPTFREISELTSDDHQLMREPIATFDSGVWTVGGFLLNYELKPIEIHYDNKNTVRSGLKNAIATLVRDYVLSEQGIKEGLDGSPSVFQEVRYWTEKLVANRVKRDLYYDNWLSDLLADLWKNSHIIVDSTALYATETSDRGLSRKIDFVFTLLE